MCLDRITYILSLPGVTRMNRLFILLIVIVSGLSHYARAAGQQYTVAGPGVAYRAPRAVSQ
jgi:hypothetical protein